MRVVCIFRPCELKSGSGGAGLEDVTEKGAERRICPSGRGINFHEIAAKWLQFTEDVYKERLNGLNVIYTRAKYDDKIPFLSTIEISPAFPRCKDDAVVTSRLILYP